MERIPYILRRRNGGLCQLLWRDVMLNFDETHKERDCLKTYSTFRDSPTIAMRRGEGTPPYDLSFCDSVREM